MPRNHDEESTTQLSFFEQRRRMRRVRMIVDLTADLIRRDPSLSIREARCLVDCARKAILELLPTYGSRFELTDGPMMERMIFERWSSEDRYRSFSLEIVN